MPPIKLLLTAATAALLAPATALAATTGGVTAPSGGGTVPASPSGGTLVGSAPTNTRTAPAPSGGRPTLASFSLSSGRLYAYGAPLRISFEIDGGPARLPVSLRVKSGGTLVKKIPLGSIATGTPFTYSLAPDVSLPEGPLELRIRAKNLRRGAHASAAGQVVFAGHAFPLRGAFTYGDGFGVDRPGHKHQGQDLLAAEGTPIVAVRGGTVTKVAFQEGGAGNYVVVDAAGEDRDYVYMHMLDGSTRVREGQRVRTGQQLGDVGSTGASSANHLHFEIWEGAWYGGGAPIDPLPDLKRWRGAT